MVEEQNDSDLVELRRKLHATAELSGQERETAKIIGGFLESFPPDARYERLGGNGIAVLYRGQSPGNKILIRCDMDALPMSDHLDQPWRSINPGVSHQCGHDGHMAIVAGLAQRLSRRRPERGSVMLLFQPAEEIGAGASAVLKEQLFRKWIPDQVFGFHNLPGFPLGHVILRKQVFAAASRGLVLRLRGVTSHAGEPDKGRSPAMAVADLIHNLSGVPQERTPMHEGAKVTLIHARVGERAFGTSPGEGEVLATLRSYSTGVMEDIVDHVETLAHGIAAAHELDLKVSWREVFPVTHNHASSVAIIEKCARELGYECVFPPHPFPWSEDFGHYTTKYPGAFFGLGVGIDQPPLHHPRYDFPDDLIPLAVAVLSQIICHALNQPHMTQTEIDAVRPGTSAE